RGSGGGRGGRHGWAGGPGPADRASRPGPRAARLRRTRDTGPRPDRGPVGEGDPHADQVRRGRGTDGRARVLETVLAGRGRGRFGGTVRGASTTDRSAKKKRR